MKILDTIKSPVKTQDKGIIPDGIVKLFFIPSGIMGWWMSLQNRVKAVRMRLKMTQEEFAKKIKLKVFSISRYETGSRVPDTNTLQKLKEVYHVDLNWLLTGEGEMYQRKPYLPDEGPLQRMYVEGEIAAGNPTDVIGERLDTFEIGKRLVPNVNDFFCFRVNGYSMEPDILHNDLVIIQKSQDWHANVAKTCAVKIDGEITLKRVVHDQNKKMIILVSDNKEYDPIIVNPKDTKVELLGPIHMIIRRFLH